MKNRQKQLVGIAAVIVLAIAGLLLGSRIGHSADKDDTSAASASPAADRTSNGDSVVHMPAATQARIGIRTQVLTAQKLKPQLVAYGRLEEDPSRSFVLRAPISGILRSASGSNWPSLGEHLAAGATIGTIQPRFTPAERIGLTTQLTTAESDLKAGTATLAAARSAYHRAKVLNADNKNVSDQVLQDAAARLQAEEAKYQAAKETVQRIQASLQTAKPAGGRQLVVERGGDVIALMAQPGESIEPGSPILRVTNLNHLLARVDIPVGRHVPASVTTAQIVAVGFEREPIPARRIAVAVPAGTPQQGQPPQTEGEAFLFRLANNLFGLRPGLAVTAYIDLPSPPQPGVIVPQSAVVRYQGSGFAYVQTAKDQFVRKQLPLDRPTKSGYFTSHNFQPGDRVVVVGAESLLSEELKSLISGADND